MSETILQDFTKSLIVMMEMEEPARVTERSVASEHESPYVEPSLVGLHNLVSFIAEGIPPPSESSCAWLEMIRVETSIRNRDRFSLLWPLISAHYSKMLGRNQASDAIVKFNYATERYLIFLPLPLSLFLLFFFFFF